ncbi:MAG TPA: PfkB family carbohydrate kinase, partial [Candidatus Nanopelagicales bacterium]|nr:PfkB family carbohydrate kinase [Candidatus Nanopelagicales bacterium]
TVAALDHPAAYLATVGTSSLGEEAMEDLRAHNIDIRFVERVDGADPVTSTLIITSDGERYIAFDDAPLVTTPLASTRTIADALSEAEVLLIDAPTAPPGSIDVVLQARASGIPVVLDAERDPTSTVRALIDAADHLVIPLSFGADLTGGTAPADIATSLWNERRSAVVLTDGPRGAYAAESPESVRHVPAFDTPVVDTTGCGDAFHGAYAWGFTRGADLATRVQIASAAAAVVAALPPETKRVPTRTAVEQLLTLRGST